MKNILVILAILFTVSTETMAQFSFTSQTSVNQFFVDPTKPENIFYRANVNYEVLPQVFITVGHQRDGVDRLRDINRSTINEYCSAVSIGNKYMFHGYDPVYLDDPKSQTPFVPIDSTIRFYSGIQINYYTSVLEQTDYDVVLINRSTPAARGEVKSFNSTTYNHIGATATVGMLIRINKNISTDISAGIEYRKGSYQSDILNDTWSSKYVVLPAINIGISYGL